MAIRIVTDSAADVPADLARELGLDVVPLTIRFGSEEFRDGIDMRADAFYRRLARGGPLPATAQPSPAAFAEVYERAARAGERVVSIHLSGALSGTVQSARLAAEQVPDARV
ncbi:MAG TPA: DegV family protein, partial [Limnochordia bacterium]